MFDPASKTVLYPTLTESTMRLFFRSWFAMWGTLCALLLLLSGNVYAQPGQVRTAVFPVHLVGDAQGWWYEIGWGIRGAIRDHPRIKVAYAWDDRMVQQLGARRLRLQDGELEKVWIQPSPYTLGEPNLELVYQIAQRVGLDLVILYGMELSIETLNAGGSFRAAQSGYVVDPWRRRVFSYQDEDTDSYASEVSPGISWTVISGLLEEYLASVGAE